MAMLEVRDRPQIVLYLRKTRPAGRHLPQARGPQGQSASWMSSRAWTSPSNKGDVVAILGPSGSGKTTLLRCLNFLETTDSGTLIFDGEAV